MTASKGPRGAVHSVGKAMELIEQLLRVRHPMSLAELCAATGFPKSTIHALLATLAEYEMIRQGTDGRYFLGVKLYECGCAVAAKWDVRQTARPFLEQLAQKTEASAALFVRSEDSVLCIDRCAAGSGAGFQVTAEDGSRLPLHATAPGKLLLSALSDAELHRVCRDRGLRPFTRHTLTEEALLKADLEGVRVRGCAIEDGEYRVGLRAVAAPVYEADGLVRHALSVMGLFPKPGTEEFRQIAEDTAAAAAALSAALGYSGG